MGKQQFDPPLIMLFGAACLVGFAVWLRLLGTDWDGWASLHPDERHMVFVTNDIVAGMAQGRGAGLSMYDLLFGAHSPMDPRASGRMMVYGDFPVLSIAWLVTLTGATDWGGVLWTGRVVTALIDSSTVLAVFLLGHRVTQRSDLALLAAVFYALAPTPLQLANFYTVDAWLMAAATWALLPLLRLGFGPVPGIRDTPRGEAMAAITAGAMLGLGMACKVSGAAMALPAVIAIMVLATRRGAVPAGTALILGVVATLVMFRIAHPFAFAGPGLFGVTVSPLFLDSFKALVAFTFDPNVPPNWQWLAGYPIWALLRDLILFGVGPAVALALIAAVLARRQKYQAQTGISILLLMTALTFLIIGVMSEVKALRYFAPALPVFCVLASIGAVALPVAARIGLVALSIWWGMGAARLHDGQHPRLIATEWMRGLPTGTKLGVETGWDEALPVVRYPPEWLGLTVPEPIQELVQVPLYLTDLEGSGTAKRLAAALQEVDYVVLSSGRQIEVMPRLPKRFPTVTRYYAALASGDLCFERAFHLDRGFPLPGIRIDDQMVQEPWRVYDHPIVSIWRKSACFSQAQALRILSAPNE